MLVINYNECENSDYVIFDKIKQKISTNITFRPGLRFSSLDIEDGVSDTRNISFDSSIGITLGVEAEFILPFNNDTWSIIIEPTYQYLDTEQTKQTDEISGGVLISKIDYKSIELPIGIRHYFYFKDKSKLFANISYVLDFQSNSTLEFLRNDGSTLSEFEINSTGNLALGLGYKYHNKYSLEIRFNTNRSLLGESVTVDPEYNSLNLIFGYTIF